MTSAGQPFRYVDLGPMGPFEMTGQMPVLVGQVKETGRPALTTSVWGQTHLNVGWFDDVDSTLDLDRCDELGVAVIRRPVYGGGTAYYQEGCSVMWAWLLPGDDRPLDEHLERFQPVLLDALKRLGCEAVQFEGSSDLRWEGRKLGALTTQDVMGCVSVGGFLNVAPPDLDTYLEVVRIPDDKFRDKAVKDMREYVCTLEQVSGHPVTYEDFRRALVDACTHAGLVLEAQPLTDEERDGVGKIAAHIADPGFVRRVSSARFETDAPNDCRVGFGNHKGHKLCRAGVAIADDGTIAAAMMAGDMHVGPPKVIDQVAAALVGARAGDTADLRARIAEVFEADEVHQADANLGVTTDDLLAAVEQAIASAARPMSA
jgi:lipoate-protein ligase A